MSFAAEHRHAEVVKTCLASGANADARDHVHFQTPRMWAEMNGHDIVVAILRKHDVTV